MATQCASCLYILFINVTNSYNNYMPSSIMGQ